jgi:MFS family permease
MAMDRLKRYRMIAIGAALLMSVGSFLLTRLAADSSITLAIVFMVLTGVGIGSFFTLPMVAVQNALPVNQLGIGTAALRYLGQVGATLGIAIVGTVVTSGISGELMSQLPTNDTDKLALAAALQHGFLAVLVFAVIALVAVFFLQDAPVTANSEDPAPESAAADSGQELLRA